MSITIQGSPGELSYYIFIYVHYLFYDYSMFYLKSVTSKT